MKYEFCYSRYWAVTNVDYIHSRTTGRVSMMIFLVWISAVIVSLAPQFGWKDPEYMERIEQQKCMVSQDIGYQVRPILYHIFTIYSIWNLFLILSFQIFATCSTFYVPLLIILILYWKIYQTARKRIHRRRPKQILSANNNQVRIFYSNNLNSIITIVLWYTVYTRKELNLPSSVRLNLHLQRTNKTEIPEKQNFSNGGKNVYFVRLNILKVVKNTVVQPLITLPPEFCPQLPLIFGVSS